MRMYRHPRFPYAYQRPWAIRKVWLEQKGYFRKLARYSSATFLVAALAALNILLLHQAHASSGYAASDVIGQRDGNGDADFNNNTYANWPTPNNSGADGAMGTAVDTVHNRLFTCDSTGTFSGRVDIWDLNSSDNVNGNTSAGRLITNVIGQPDFKSANTTTDQSTIGSCDLAYDSVNNRLFVNDEHANRVLVFDLSSGITNGMAASYVIGQADFTSSSTTVSQKQFSDPGGDNGYIAYDDVNDRLFVSDSGNNRVLVFNVNPGTIANGENAQNVIGQPDYITSAGTCSNVTAPAQNRLCQPEGLAYDSGTQRLFVADSGNSRVLVFNVNTGTIANGENAENEFGQADFTHGNCDRAATTMNTYDSGDPPTANTLCYPLNLAFDPNHNLLFVSDGGPDFSYQSRILVFDVNTGTITNGENAENVLGEPDFTSFQSDDNNCGSDTNDTANAICGVSGTMGYDAANDRLWVPDRSNGRVDEFDLSGGISNNMSAVDELGEINGGTYVPDFTNGDGSREFYDSADLGYPTATAVDPVHHRLFAADIQGRLLVYGMNNSNTQVNPFAEYLIGQPWYGAYQSSGCTQITNSEWFIGMDYDSVHDRLFLTDAGCSRVLVYDFSGGISNNMPASYVLGEPDFTTSTGGVSQNTLDYPNGVAYDSANQRLFVADNSDSRVLVYNLSGGISNGMNASYVLGQPDFSSDTCNTSQAGLCDPEDVVYSSSTQQLYVADYGNNRVLDYDLSGGISNGMNATHVLGQADFTSSNSGTSQNTLDEPIGLGLDDANGHLFVGDDGNNRVLMFNVGIISDNENAAMVLGQTDFTTNDSCGSVSTTEICDPEGHIAYDPTSHRLYVPDSDNNRITIYNFANIATSGGSLPNGTVGSSYFQTISKAGGQGTQSFSVTSGALPAGLSLDGSTGVISGTPTLAGNYSFTITLTDDNGSSGSYTDSAVYSLNISGGAGGYLASDELGQRNGIGNVDFSSSDFIHAPRPNNIGTTGPGVVLDSVHHRLFQVEGSNIWARVDVWNLDSNNDIAGNTASARLIDNVLGQPDFTTSNNTADQQTLTSVGGIAYDSNNNRLFVADENGNRILVFDLSGGISNGMNASYVLGQTDFTSTGAATTQSGLSHPGALGYDDTNNRLFVTDNYNSRVLVYDLAGGITDGMNASYVLGQADFVTGATCPTTPTQSSLSFDCGLGSLAYDKANSRLFVSDPHDDRIMIFDVTPGTITNNENAKNVLGQTSFTAGDCEGAGRPDYNAGLGVVPDASSLCALGGVVYDPNHDRLFAGDNFRALVFDVTPGTITDGENAGYVLGQADFSSSVNNCLPVYGADASTVCNMMAGAYDPSNDHLWLSGDENGDIGIRLFDFSGGISNNMAAVDALISTNGGLFTPNFHSTLGDENMLLSDTLSSPSASALDPVHHRLFVGDMDRDGIFVYNLDSNNNLPDSYADYIIGGEDAFQEGAPDCQSNGNNDVNQSGYYIGLVYDSASDRLFVADGSCQRVEVYDLSGGITSGMAASYVIGQPDFTSKNGCSGNDGATLLCEPQGLAYDSANKRLFVSDGSNDRVMVYDLSGGVSNGMAASYVLGEPDFNTDTGCNATTAAGLCFSYDLAYDQSTQRLYVVDGGNDRVVEYDLSGGISDGMAASHVLGQPDLTSSASATTANGLNCPEGLGFDSANEQLFVDDECNNRVVMYNAATISDDENASFELGQQDFISGKCNQNLANPNQESLCFPEGHIAYDSTNHRLYVPDSSNNRVMIYDFAHITTATLPAGSVGSSYSQTIGKTGGQGTQSFSLTSGSLPGGLSFDGSTGALSGTPTSSGTYDFTVTLTDDNGSVGAYTDSVAYNVTINGSGGGDTQAPTAPINLTVTGVTTTSVSLSWTASTDNVGVVGYHIYRDGGGSPIASTPGTTYTDTGLATGTTYTYQVTAYDAASNESPPSNQVSATTLTNSSGGGTSGGSTSSGGSSGGTSSSGGSGGSSSGSTKAPAPAPIDLDSLPPVSSTDACKDVSSATAGQVYSFTAHDGSDHKITVLQVGADTIEIKIDNLPKTLRVGELISQDVNGDGVPDICIDVIAITGGKVELKIDRIILAVAPGGHTSSGFGAGAGAGSGSPAKKGYRLPPLIILVFPWLLFALLALSMLRLAYLAFQERRLAGQLQVQLAKEKALGEEKHNFMALSSHYLRTPMSEIANGIELLISLKADGGHASELKELSEQMGNSVNQLLDHTSPAAAPVAATGPTTGLVVPNLGSLNTAAGFIKGSSLSVISLALLGSFAVVGVCDLILRYVDLYDVKAVTLLIQLAALLAVSIMLFATSRSYHKRKEMHELAERALADERSLQAGRDQLVKASLEALRAPLIQLKGRLAAMPAANPKALKPVADGVARLEGLLGKFTILSSLRSGGMGIVRQPVELGQLARQSLQRYDRVLQSKGLSVRDEVGPVQLAQDPLLLTFVIDSLLANAIKYSPAGAEITLSSRRHGHQAYLEVSDHGPGIAPDKQAQLFEPFSRAEDAERDFDRQGAGLSLYLDKLIMGYLDGELAMHSQPGQGTTVSFSVPGSL